MQHDTGAPGATGAQAETMLGSTPGSAASNCEGLWQNGVTASDAAATSTRERSPCNDGSQGVGSHCTGNHDLMDTYCSHCPNGEWAGSHNRMGCGHDSHGYGHAGELWVR